MRYKIKGHNCSWNTYNWLLRNFGNPLWRSHGLKFRRWKKNQKYEFSRKNDAFHFWIVWA